MPCLPRDLDLAHARVASAPRVGGVPIVVIPYIHPQIALELLYLYLTLHLAEVHPRIAACKQDHYTFVPLVGTVHVHAFPKLLQFSQGHSHCLVLDRTSPRIVWSTRSPSSIQSVRQHRRSSSARYGHTDSVSIASSALLPHVSPDSLTQRFYWWCHSVYARILRSVWNLSFLAGTDVPWYVRCQHLLATSWSPWVGTALLWTAVLLRIAVPVETRNRWFGFLSHRNSLNWFGEECTCSMKFTRVWRNIV